MKKLAFILLTALISTTAFCAEPDESWVKTDEGQTQCEKVVVRKGYLYVTCKDGKQQQFPVSEVTSYSKKGKTYIKHSIFTENYQPGAKKSEVFMQLVASKDGMDLLRYTGSTGVRVFVFKGDQLVQELISTNPNRKEYYEFFGI